MPRERITIRALGVVAALVAVLGLGMFLSWPEVAVAQENTPTTVADDTTSTVAEDDATDTTGAESTDESTESDTARSDHDCADATANGSEGSS